MSPMLREHGCVTACAAALLTLCGCAGDRSGSGRTGSQDSISHANAGKGASPPAAGANGSAQSPAAPMDAAPAAPAADPGGPPAGTFKPRPSLDPGAMFEWPESAPGSGESCQAGTYTGTYACMFMDPSGAIPPIELTGPVSLTFTRSVDGEFLEIANGEFEAVANLFIGARAKIAGKLDCDTLSLQAMAVEGMWALGDPDAPLLPGGGLAGDITGTLDPATGILAGDWTLGDPAIGNCPGTWSVTYVP
jgi:hypothetical protein